MVDPGNEELRKYYSQFGLKEYMLPKEKSIYDVDTYYFTNIKDMNTFKERVAKEYSK